MLLLICWRFDSKYLNLLTWGLSMSCQSILNVLECSTYDLNECDDEWSKSQRPSMVPQRPSQRTQKRQGWHVLTSTRSYTSPVPRSESAGQHTLSECYNKIRNPEPSKNVENLQTENIFFGVVLEKVAGCVVSVAMEGFLDVVVDCAPFISHRTIR